MKKMFFHILAFAMGVLSLSAMATENTYSVSSIHAHWNGTANYYNADTDGWCLSETQLSPYSKAIGTYGVAVQRFEWTPPEGYYISEWHLHNAVGNDNGAYPSSYVNAVELTYSTIANQFPSLTATAYLAPYCREIHYTPSFDANGGTWSGSTPATEEHAYFDTVTLPTPPTMVGYTFSGWSASTGKTISSTTTTVNGNSLGVTENGQPVTLTAQWTVNQYNLVLTPGTGIARIGYKIESESEWTYVSASTTVPVNYGTTWYAYAEAATDYSHTATSEEKPASGTMGTSGASFAPTATPKTYTVSVQASPSAGGEITKDPGKDEFSYNDKVNLKAYPNDGYDFDYWSINGQKSGSDNPFELMVTNDMYCTAYFKEIVPCTITTLATNITPTAVANSPVGGTVTGGGVKTKGTQVTLTAAPSSGFSFVKWLEDESSNPEKTFTVSGDATYTACFTGNVYQVTLSADPGTVKPSKVYVTFGSPYGEFPLAKLEPEEGSGDVFDKWVEEDSGKEVTPETIVWIAGKHNINAVWKKPTDYYISFNGNGATSGTMAVQTNAVGVATALNENEYGKVGATFAGWATNVTGEVVYGDGEEVTDIAAPGKTVTLYAKWTPWKNYVKFTKGDELASGGMAVQEFEYGVSQELSENKFLKPGCTFLGWTNETTCVFYTNRQEVSFEQPDGTTNTLAAVWRVNRYTIHFEPNTNGVYGTMADMVDCVSGVATNLTPCAYTNLVSCFGGWATNETGEIAYNDKEKIKWYAPEEGSVLTLYAFWSGVGDMSKAVGLTNAVLVEAGSSTNILWKEMSGCIRCRVPKTSTFAKDQYALMTMNVMGPGVLRFKWRTQNLTSDTTNKLTVSVSAMGAFKNLPLNITSSGYQDIVLCVETSGLQTVTWRVDVKNSITGGGTPIWLDVSEVRWNPGEPTRYDIALEAGVGGSVSGGGENLLVGSETSLVATPDDDYAFVQWSDGDTANPRTVVVVSNATYVAEFIKSTFYYYVDFDGDGATSGEMPKQKVPCGVSTALNANNFGRTGYTFEKWRDSNGNYYTNREEVIDLADTNETATLHATWTANRYNIAFDGNGATSGSMSTLDCQYDTPVTLPANGFVREGYMFDSWTNAFGSVFKDRATVSNLTAEANVMVTLYAQWTDLGDLSRAVGLTNAVLKVGKKDAGNGWEKWTYGQSGIWCQLDSGCDLNATNTMGMVVEGPGKLTFKWMTYSYNTAGCNAWLEIGGSSYELNASEDEYSTMTMNVPSGSTVIMWGCKRIGKVDEVTFYVDEVRWTPDAPVRPVPTEEDRRDISKITISDGAVSLTVSNADERFDYLLRGTNTLGKLPWPVMWTTNGTGTIIIEPPKTDDPSMFYYLQTIQKQ